MRYKHKAKPEEFRLIRLLSNEVNFQRFIKHVARLTRRMRNDPFIKKIRMKNAWRRRARA